MIDCDSRVEIELSTTVRAGATSRRSTPNFILRRHEDDWKLAIAIPGIRPYFYRSLDESLT